MKTPASILGQDWVGESLISAQSWSPFGDHPSFLLLQFGSRRFCLASHPEEPQILVLEFPPEQLTHHPATDILNQAPFAGFSNCPLYSWWLMENEHGVQDGLVLLFERTEGLIILAQPGRLEFLTVTMPAHRSNNPS